MSIYPGFAYGVLLLVVAAAAWTDVKTGLVPNRLTYPAVLLGLLYWPLVGLFPGDHPSAWALCQSAWLGMLAGLVPFAVLVLSGGLGGGDMKLMAAAGAWSASWQVVLSTTVYALLVAALMAAFVMVRRGVVKQTLARVFSAALLARHRLKADPSPDGATVPFAAAVAVGAAVAGAEQMLGLQTPWRSFGP